MECPLCGNTFPSEKIEEHVNACLDTSAAPPSPIVDPPTPPKVIEPTPIITKPVIKTTGAGDTYEVMQQEHNHKKILIDETEEPDTAMPDAKSEEELNEEQLAKMQVKYTECIYRSSYVEIHITAGGVLILGAEEETRRGRHEAGDGTGKGARQTHYHDYHPTPQANANNTNTDNNNTIKTYRDRTKRYWIGKEIVRRRAKSDTRSG